MLNFVFFALLLINIIFIIFLKNSLKKRTGLPAFLKEIPDGEYEIFIKSDDVTVLLSLRGDFLYHLVYSNDIEGDERLILQKKGDVISFFFSFEDII